jgi:hypothetical protein
LNGRYLAYRRPSRCRRTNSVVILNKMFRLRRALLSVLLGLLICSPFIIAQGTDQKHFHRLQGVVVGRQKAHYQDCVDNMYASDANGDLALSDEEYVMFIEKESEGAIVVDDLSELPFSLVVHFIYGACFCSIIFQAPNCCVGGEAAIDLDPENSPFILDNLITICISVKQAIGDEVGTSPPVATSPNQIPTVSPTTTPTETLTMSPTTPPVVQTTSKWNSTITFFLFLFLTPFLLYFDSANSGRVDLC